MVEQALDPLDRELGAKPYTAGDTFTIAGSAVFCAERWASQEDIALPPKLAGHFERTKASPAVARARGLSDEA